MQSQNRSSDILHSIYIFWACPACSISLLFVASHLQEAGGTATFLPTSSEVPFTPREMGGSNIRSNHRRRRGVAGAFMIGSLVVLVALVCIGENGEHAFGRKQRRLKTKAQAAVPRPTTTRKMADNIKAKASHTVAVHEWKTNHVSDTTTARALKNNHCPPGVDSVTGSFCGLSYEQICCFCPQPADCEAGCPADGDGVVRDGCFHHIT